VLASLISVDLKTLIIFYFYQGNDY